MPKGKFVFKAQNMRLERAGGGIVAFVDPAFQLNPRQLDHLGELLAASPEMHELLEEAVSRGFGPAEWLERVRATLKRIPD